MKEIVISLIALFCLFNVNAQNSAVSAVNSPEANQLVKAEDKMVIEVTNQYFNQLENYYTAGSEFEVVSKFLDKDFSSTLFILDVTGKQTRSDLNLTSFKAQLDATKKIQGIKVNYVVESINFVRSYEALATINFTALITAQIDGEVVLRFRSFITNYLRKNENGDWKIFESTGINAIKEQEVGICPCTISQQSKDDLKYEAKVLYPSGNSFTNEVIAFEFKPSAKATLILSGNNAYTWENEQLTCVKENGEVVSIKLGKAANKPEVINLILGQQLLSKRCLGFKTISQ